VPKAVGINQHEIILWDIGDPRFGELPFMRGPDERRGVMGKRQRISSYLICIGLIVVTLGCASTPTRESTGEYIDDSTITTKVKAAIFNDPSLKVFQINVETFKGEVQLSGSVDSDQIVNKAGEVARGVGGVKSVKNDLIVK